MLLRAWSGNMLPFRAGRGQRSHWLAGTRQEHSDDHSRCPVGLFCNDQHVQARLLPHTSPQHQPCFAYTHFQPCVYGSFSASFITFMHLHVLLKWTNSYFLPSMPPSALLYRHWLWLMNASMPSPSSISKHRKCRCYSSTWSPFLLPQNPSCFPHTTHTAAAAAGSPGLNLANHSRGCQLNAHKY